MGNGEPCQSLGSLAVVDALMGNAAWISHCVRTTSESLDTALWVSLCHRWETESQQ